MKWYALRSKSQKEEILSDQVAKRGYEVFYPRVKVCPINPRARRIRPFFPGYVFVHVNIEEVGLSCFRWMPYSLGLVSFGGEPAYIPDSALVSIRRHVEALNGRREFESDNLSKGDMVRIIDGPLVGYEAIFDARMSGSERVRVLLTFISGRGAQVQLARRSIEPIESN